MPASRAVLCRPRSANLTSSVWRLSSRGKKPSRHTSFRRGETGDSRKRYRIMYTPARAKDVRRLGFFPRNNRRHTLLAKFADRGLHKTALDAGNWSYSAGDGEMTFWVR